MINYIFYTSSILLKLYFDIFYYKKLNKEITKSYKEKTNEKGVSIIICGRDEIKNIKKNIKSFVNQKHHNFEIIYVDDGSKDNSVNYLKSEYPLIKVIETKDYNNKNKGKKNALIEGVKEANNEIILLSDCDCYPISDQWVKNMTIEFKNETTEIVLGISHYKTYKNSLINKIVQYDGFITAINYISFSLSKKTYMGIGRNVAYLKSSFLKSNKLKETSNIASGDDDLLINDIANKKNTFVCLKEESLTISEPEKTWKGFFQQKKRHYSTPIYYKKDDQLRLSLNYLSYLLYNTSIIFSIINKNFIVLFIFVVIKLITNKILLQKFAEKIQYSHILWYSSVLEIILIGLQPILYISNILKPNKKWK
jgi:glycosyltransferase involved in cell wall biosynthesis